MLKKKLRHEYYYIMPKGQQDVSLFGSKGQCLWRPDPARDLYVGLDDCGVVACTAKDWLKRHCCAYAAEELDRLMRRGCHRLPNYPELREPEGWMLAPLFGTLN